MPTGKYKIMPEEYESSRLLAQVRTEECLTEQHPQSELELLGRIAKLQIACSEERIRAIVREELAAWEKRLVQRARIGMPMETK